MHINENFSNNHTTTNLDSFHFVTKKVFLLTL